MEDISIEERIKEMKLAATSQTEFVHGIIILLIINCKALDEAIENFGNDDLKGVVKEVRKSLPELLMAISTEVELIHTQNNQLI